MPFSSFDERDKEKKIEKKVKDFSLSHLGNRSGLTIEDGNLARATDRALPLLFPSPRSCTTEGVYRPS
jgi:hypothetical protein